MNKLQSLIRRCLEHPWLPLGLVVLVVLLSSPSLEIGWILDDEIHRASLTAQDQFPELARSPVDLFAFIGDRWPSHDDFLPWWANEDLRIAFLRPVTGFTHWLDYQLWPENAWWMHAHSILWAVLVVLLGALYYQRILDRENLWVAGLAALLFAVDDTHALATVWIAQRNGLVSLGFGLLTLFAYHRWRREGWKPGAVLAPLLLLMAVLSAEAAVACGAYLLSYALFLDTGPLKSRLLALLPCSAVGILWQLAYRVLGYGAAASELYLDPGAEPLRFLVGVVERAPIYLWGQLAFPPSDLLVFLSSSAGRLFWWSSLVGLGLFTLLLLPILRQDATARFFTFGMLLALLPCCAIYPNQRVLYFVSLGAAGLVAVFVDRAWSLEGSQWWRFAARGVAGGLLFINVVLAPLSFLSTAPMWASAGHLMQRAGASLPDDADDQHVILVGAPSSFISASMSVSRLMSGRTMPRRISTLATTIHPIEVLRPDARTLILRPQGGFLAPIGTMPAGKEAPPFDFMYAFQLSDGLFFDGRPFQVGQKIDRGDFILEISALTEDQRPAEVTFRFSANLEDKGWRWMRWEDLGFAPWHPPAVGEAEILAAPRLF